MRIDFSARLGIKSTTPIDGTTARRLLADGAHSEDDLPRSLHHFLDPIRGRALTVPPLCNSVGIPADRWALDDTALNAFDLGDAKSAYFQTLLSLNTAERERNLKNLFFTLGHIVHLVQDMAQPEHTRNDQHLDFSHYVLGNGVEPSVWEAWGAENLVPRRGISAVPYDGYPTVELPDYRSYFTSPLGMGMADFANANFVTQDTNYGDSSISPSPCSTLVPAAPRCFLYGSPRIGDAIPRIVTVDEAVIDASGNVAVVTVDERVFTSFTFDNYLQRQETDPFHTFQSLLDMETRYYGCEVYSLGEPSYLTRASMLVPRAVAYTAGLIEHFFRGKIDVEWVPVNPGVYDMKITNRTNEPIGADAKIGAVYRATPAYLGTSNDAAPIVTGNLSALVPGYQGLGPNESVVIRGVRPDRLRPDDSILEFERRVALFGRLGDEIGAVVGLVQPVRATGGALRIVGKITPPFLNWAIYTADSNGGPSYDAMFYCPDNTFNSFPGTTISLDCTNGQSLGTFTMDPVLPNRELTLSTVGCVGCSAEFQVWKGEVLLKTFHPGQSSRYRILCTDLETCRVEHLSGPGD